MRTREAHWEFGSAGVAQSRPVKCFPRKTPPPGECTRTGTTWRLAALQAQDGSCRALRSRRTGAVAARTRPCLARPGGRGGETARPEVPGFSRPLRRERNLGNHRTAEPWAGSRRWSRTRCKEPEAGRATSALVHKTRAVPNKTKRKIIDDENIQGNHRNRP